MVASVVLGSLLLAGATGGPTRPAPGFEWSPPASARLAGSPSSLMALLFPPSRRPAVPPSAASAWALPPATGLPQQEPDPWLGEDKLKHFLVSFAATSFAASMARAAGLGHGGALAAGAGLGAAAGIWKEVHDRASGGDVSARDLVADAAGVAGGTVLAAQTR